jgi:hypothetical protein
MLGCLQYVGAGAIPGKMLHHFQKAGQGCRSDACADTGKEDGHPEPRGTWTLKGGGYRVEVRGRWRFGRRQCDLCFRSRWPLPSAQDFNLFKSGLGIFIG